MIKVCNFFSSSVTKFLASFEWMFCYCFKFLFQICSSLSNLFFSNFNIGIFLFHFFINFSFMFIYVCFSVCTDSCFCSEISFPVLFKYSELNLTNAKPFSFSVFFSCLVSFSFSLSKTVKPTSSHFTVTLKIQNETIYESILTHSLTILKRLHNLIKVFFS